MTSVASHAAGARTQTTEHTVTVRLTQNDLTLISAFVAWRKDSPTCSPKKDQIERGYGAHRFAEFTDQKGPPGKCWRTDMTGPHTFKRLVALHVIEHSRNGHCWLTAEGERIAREIGA